MKTGTRRCLWLCCIFCALNTSWSTRKYDVELEALKLYKEDIRTVLHRFRRTADYLKIIDASMKLYMLQTENLAMATLFHYNKKLEEKVKEMMGYDKTTTSNGVMTESTTAKYFQRRRGGFRRDEDNGNPIRAGQENQNMVDLLDRYKKLTSKLTVAQKNEMKNMGFMYAGEVIHNIIANLKEADDDPDGPSTRGPSDDGKGLDSSTRHVSVHEVKGTVDGEITTPEPRQGDEALRAGDEGNTGVDGTEGAANQFMFRSLDDNNNTNTR